MRFRMPDPLFQPLGGIACTFEPFLTPRLLTSYTAKHPSFGLRWFHRLGLTDSHGSHPLGLCLASTCALIIADLDPLVKGFSEIFSEFFLSLSFHPLGSPSGLARLIRSLTPTLRATSSSRVAYQSQRLPTFRAIATCSGGQPDPLGIIPFRWSYCITLGWVCQGFLRIFFADPRTSYSGISGSQDLAFVTLASPCSATIRGPRRGWGSHPLLTLL